ncbi:MAG: hypothetical protein QM761_09080 [Pseudoxanthomonas sp.]
MIRSCCLGLILGVVTGCSAYTIERPQTEAGRICAERCDAVQNLCYSQAESEAASAARHCSSQQARVDEHCDPYTRAEDRSHCQAVNQRPLSCSTPAADTGPCRTAWRQCVLECGGRLIER